MEGSPSSADPHGAVGQELQGLVARIAQVQAAGRRPRGRTPEVSVQVRGVEEAQVAELVRAQRAFAQTVSAQVVGRREPGDDEIGLDDLAELDRLPFTMSAGGQNVEFSMSLFAALGIACTSCVTLLCLIATCVAGPPLIAVVYCWAWVTWLSHFTAPCDQPLDEWLGVYLLYSVAVLCCSPVIMQVFCLWSPFGNRGQVPIRIKALKVLNPVVAFSWMVYGKILLNRSKSCQATSPGLYGFVGWFSWLFLAVHFLHMAWMGLTVAGVPLVLFLARRGSLHPALLWLANRGFLQTAGGANPDLINDLEVVEYTPELFADPSAPADPRPQGECCICLQVYDATKTIRRTPCGHLMHHECLGMWLQTATTCPACRGDLNGPRSAREVIV